MSNIDQTQHKATPSHVTSRHYDPCVRPQFTMHLVKYSYNSIERAAFRIVLFSYWI